MPMLLLRVVLVLEPLLQLPVPTDLVRGDARALPHECLAEGRVYVERFRRGDAVREEVADDLVVHRRPRDEAADLRRV